MSRIGKLPISLPDGVKVELDGLIVKVTGPKGILTQEISNNISVEIEDKVVNISRNDETKSSNERQGLYRQLINNMVIGVKDGFKKGLVVQGVGYKIQKQGNKVVMNLGMSHPVEFVEEDGVSFEVIDNTKINVCGISKEKVGAMAAKIRASRPMEPYHGYGIHYASEKVILKPGKTTGKKK